MKLGAYSENLHGLSLRQRMFDAKDYYWLEWPRAVQDLLEKQGDHGIAVGETHQS